MPPKKGKQSRSPTDAKGDRSEVKGRNKNGKSVASSSAATASTTKDDKRLLKGKEKGAVRLPDGIKRHNLEELTGDKAILLYERDQVLWLRLMPSERKKCSSFGMSALRTLQKQCPSLFSSHWSVENPGEHDKVLLTAKSVFGKAEPPAGQYYVSSILQKDTDGLAKFFRKVPFSEPVLLQKAKAKHDDGVWLFVGSNPRVQDPNTTKKSKKRLRGEDTVLRGRPEHTDAVDHSGTWHMQLKGHKTWFIRPCLEADDWGENPPQLTEGKDGVVRQERGGTRLELQCEEGDLLLVNTRAWWHRTDIGQQDGEEGLSVSYARDFYLASRPQKEKERKLKSEELEEDEEEEEDCKTNDNTLDPRMFARADFNAGAIILQEEELPDGDLPRSTSPNCSLAELDDDSIALVALRPISKGEPLAVGVGEDSDEEEYEEWELDPETGEMMKVEG